MIHKNMLYPSLLYVARRILTLHSYVYHKIHIRFLCLTKHNNQTSDHLDMFDGPGNKSALLYSAHDSSQGCIHSFLIRSSGAILTLIWFQQESQLSFFYTTIIISTTKNRLLSGHNLFSSQSQSGTLNTLIQFSMTGTLFMQSNDKKIVSHVLTFRDFLFEGPSVLIPDGHTECQYGGLYVVFMPANGTLKEWCVNQNAPFFYNVEGSIVILMLWYSGYSEGHVNGNNMINSCPIQSYITSLHSPITITPQHKCASLFLVNYNGYFDVAIKGDFTPFIGPLFINIQHAGPRGIFWGEKWQINQTSLNCIDTKNIRLRCIYSHRNTHETFVCNSESSFRLSKCTLKSRPCQDTRYDSLITIMRSVCTDAISIFADKFILPGVKCYSYFTKTQIPRLYLISTKYTLYNTAIISRGIHLECSVHPQPFVEIRDNKIRSIDYYKYTLTSTGTEYNLLLNQAVISLVVPANSHLNE